MRNSVERTVLMFVVGLATLLILIGFVGVVHASDSNPCGNHGNHCCLDNGGDENGGATVSVDQECTAFCQSTAFAVSVAVSECEAKASATCKQTCGDAVNVAVNDCEAKAFARSEADAKAYAKAAADASAECAQTCGVQTASAVANATANCANTCINTCSQPICLNARKKHRKIGGIDYTVTICRDHTD